MLSWLKKYGLKALQIGLTVIGIGGPLVEAATSNASAGTQTAVASGVDTATKIATGIQTIETSFAAAFGSNVKTGAQKIQALQPIVQQAIQLWLTNQFPGTAKISNQILFAQGCGEIGQGFVDVMNSIENNPTTATAVETSGTAAPAPAPQPVPAAS